MKPVQARVPDHLLVRIEAVAEARAMTLSDLIRESLETYLDDPIPTIDASDEQILASLTRKALLGSVPAARELLRHRRWEAENHRLADNGGQPDRLDELRAELRARRERRRESLSGRGKLTGGGQAGGCSQ